MKHIVTIHSERRGAERRPIVLGTVMEDAVQPAIVLMDDISAGGFGMVSVAPLAAGDRITVDLPRIGQRSATVVRQDGVRFGCVFATPMATDELQQVVDAGAELHALRQQRAASGWRPGTDALAA